MRPELTPGQWTYVEGEPGFMGSLEEPPMEPYPPTIVAHTPERGEVEIAQLVTPHPEDAVYDPESGEREVLGDADANGRLMAAAVDLKNQLHMLVATTKLHCRQTKTEPCAVLDLQLQDSAALLERLDKK